jgi:hypothetical integral membrane protein (TIGR02206 family)
MDAHATTAFVLLGWDHVLTVLIVAVVSIGLPLAVRQSDPVRLGRLVAVGLAVALVAHEGFKTWVYIGLSGQPAIANLPLHLCNVATLLTAYVLVRRSYQVYEIAYFWGMCGSLVAMLTPDLQSGFPSIFFVTFFLGHGLVVLGIVFATLVFEFRPTVRSMVKAIVVTAAYALAIAPLNIFLGTNYLYLRHKPEQATIIDYLGPWPWYLAALLAIAIVLCWMSLTPFVLSAWLSRRQKGVVN